MRRILVVVASALLGIALCGLSSMLFNAAWFGVHFPAPGGEDDFSVRAAAFFFGVCPAFLALGGWNGYAASRGRAHWLAAWAGAVAGTVIVFAALYLLRQPIATMSESGSATRAVFVFDALWVLVAACGAAVANRFASHHSR